MNRRKISLMLILFIGCFITIGTSFCAFIIEQTTKIEKKDEIIPNEINVSTDNFDVISAKQDFEIRGINYDNYNGMDVFLSDEISFPLIFEQQKYINGIDRNKTLNGGIQIEVSFKNSANLFNFIVENIGTNFAYIKYGDYELKAKNNDNFQYIVGDVTLENGYSYQNCIEFDMNNFVIKYIIPFAPERSFPNTNFEPYKTLVGSNLISKEFYLYKIAEDNGIDTRVTSWNFDVYFDFGFLEEFNNNLYVPILNDFKNISIDIKGVTLI